jgi:hypothetical protein
VIAHPPGEEIQFDWLELPDPPEGWGVGEHAHLLVGALAHSGRWRAVLAESEDFPHLVQALDQVVRRLGGTARRWRFDRMATVCYPSSEPAHPIGMIGRVAVHVHEAIARHGRRVEVNVLGRVQQRQQGLREPLGMGSHPRATRRPCLLSMGARHPSRARRGQRGQFLPELTRLGVADGVEKDEGLAPGVHGCWAVTDGFVRVAETC